MKRARAGSGLLEVLVALPIIALLGVVAVQLLLTLHRQVLLVDGANGAARELRHGASVMAAELRLIRPVDLVAWSDTAVEFDGLVGVGVVCASTVHASHVAVGAPDTVAYSGQALSTVWNQPPQPGDRVDVWLAGASLADSLRLEARTLTSVGNAADCARSPLVASGGQSLRLGLNATTTGAVVAGSPVRVLRRIRYSLYHASDGDWYLGRRTRGASGWDVIQPVAGPYHSPRDRGLVLRVHDAAGARIDTTRVGAAARVRIAMRAPRKAGRAAPTLVTSDSVTIDVALRAQLGGAP